MALATASIVFTRTLSCRDAHSDHKHMVQDEEVERALTLHMEPQQNFTLRTACTMPNPKPHTPHVLLTMCGALHCRDAQIQEKKHMLQEEEEEERALDLQMEVDRIRALEAYEERERQRLHESQVGALILADQISERQKERVRQEELREMVSHL